MEQFVIQSVGSTIKFELCHGEDMGLTGLDFMARIKYDLYGRTICSEHIWGLSLGDGVSFTEGMKEMYKTLKGEAHISSFEGDRLLMTMKDCGRIEVEIEDGMQGYNGFVQVNFEIDQSYLPELIKQAENFFQYGKVQDLNGLIDLLK